LGGKSHSPKKASSPRKEDKINKFGGLMNFLEWGKDKKEVLVLFHGFPDEAEIWREYGEKLGERFHVIAPQIPIEKIKIRQFQKIILNKISASSPEKTYLMGHDLGTVWASGIADILKKDLNGLILINGLSLTQFKKRLKNPNQLFKSWYMFFMQLPWIPEILMRRYPSILLKIPSYLNQPSFSPNPKGLDGFWQYRIFFKELLKTTHHPLVEAPTLVLWGSQDAFLNAPRMNEFQKEFKKVEIRILEGDHWFHLNQTDKVITLFNQFIGGANEYLGKDREKNLKTG